MSLPLNPTVGQIEIVNGTRYQCTSVNPNQWKIIGGNSHELRLQELEASVPLSANKYGANPDGVTVATTAIRNACAAANGRVLTFVGGTYLIDDEIKLDNTGGISCLGDVVFRCTGNGRFTFQDNEDWYDDLGVLTTSVDETGEKAFSVVDASSLSNGDELFLWDSNGTSFSSFRTNYYAGEMVRVDSISGNTINTVETMYGTYAANATTNVYKNNGKSFLVKGFRLESDVDASQLFGLRIVGAVELKIVDIKSNTWGSAAVSVSRSRYVKTIGCDIDMTELPATGTNYGISYANVQDAKTIMCNIKSVRHAIAHGGGTGTGCIPTRNSVVEGCTLYCTTTVGAADIHGNCEAVKYVNNTIDGGAVLGGINCAYVGNTIRNWEGASCILVSEPLGLNHVIKDNEAYVFGMASGRGGWIDCGGNTESMTADTTQNGTLVITGNTVYANGYEETGINLVKIINRGSNAVSKIVHRYNTYINQSIGDDAIFRIEVDNVSGEAFEQVTLDGVYDGAAINLTAKNVTIPSANIDGRFITKSITYPLFISATGEVELNSVNVKNANLTPIYVKDAAVVKIANVDIDEYCRSTASSVYRAGMVLQGVAYARLADVKGRTTQADAAYGLRLVGTTSNVEVALTKFTKSGAPYTISNPAGATVSYLIEEDIQNMGGVSGTATSANTLTITNGIITNIA